MLNRRTFVAGALASAATVLSGCGANSGSKRSAGNPGGPQRGASGSGSAANGGAVHSEKISYGTDRSQFGELYRAAGAAHAGVIVIIHGGFWQAQYGLSLGRPLALDLAGRGYTCWNLEYRRIGNGGGWPATFDDVAAGIDKLADIDGIDTSHVVAVGHSAGGQLAVWALGRGKLATGAPGAAPKVHLTGVVSQAGVLALAEAANTGVGGPAEEQLMGGSPSKVPQRYRIGDPIEQVPLDRPVLCVHSHADQNVPFVQSTAYVAAADKAGAKAKLHAVSGDHFTLIDPSSAAWQVVRDALPDLLVGDLPA